VIEHSVTRRLLLLNVTRIIVIEQVVSGEPEAKLDTVPVKLEVHRLLQFCVEGQEHRITACQVLARHRVFEQEFPLIGAPARVHVHLAAGEATILCGERIREPLH